MGSTSIRSWESQEIRPFPLLLLQTFDSSLSRPEAPCPSVSRPPLPPPEVEPQGGKISREPEPEAGSQIKESATVSSPAPMSPTRRRALDHYLTLRR